MLKTKLSSLKYRIAITVFILEGIMLSVVLWNTFNFVEVQAQEDLNKRHHVTFELIKQISSNSIFAEEYDDLQQYIEKISEDPGIINIAVLNNKSIIIAHNDFNKVGQKSEKFISTPEHYWLNENIDSLGSIQIEFSLASIKSQLKKAKSMGVGLAIAGMLLIAVSGLTFGFILTHRLTSLTEVISNFKDSGEYISIESTGSDEIAVLTNAFNHMSNKINNYIEKIEKDKGKLERRVDERTEELRKAKNHLVNVNAKLNVIAVTDHLTQISNRIRIEEQLKIENDRFKRYTTKYSVILLDIDNFKSVNDNYGHDIGDQVLISISNLLKRNIRSTDIIGRWGGEEFIIVCAEADLDGATQLADNLRLLIEKSIFDSVGSVTCSFGTAEIQNNETVKDLIKRSDKALYAAKEQGRNRVVKG